MLKKILKLIKNVFSIILTIAALTQPYLYPAKIYRGSFATQDGNLIDIYEITAPILNKTQVIFSNTYNNFYKKHTQKDMPEKFAASVKQHLWDMNNKRHCVFASYIDDKCIGWEFFEKTSNNTLTSYMRCYLEIKYQSYQLFAPFHFMPNINTIIVKCDPKNTGAIKFYERLGFHYCGMYTDPKGYYDLLHGLSITKSTFELLYKSQSFFDTFMSCC